MSAAAASAAPQLQRAETIGAGPSLLEVLNKIKELIERLDSIEEFLASEQEVEFSEEESDEEQ